MNAVPQFYQKLLCNHDKKLTCITAAGRAWDGNVVDAEELVSAADKCMYIDKQWLKTEIK